VLCAERPAVAGPSHAAICDSWRSCSLAPPTIKQTETEDERALGSTYHYKCGPDRGNDGKDDHVGQTILEESGLRSSNLKLADLKPDYAKTHSLTTDQAVTDHCFGTSSSNGTFTVWAGDEFSDVHSGSMPDKATFEAARRPTRPSRARRSASSPSAGS
jgi:hypothetical protein